MLTARSLVVDYLQTLMQRGLRRLPVDEESRGILRSWMLSARQNAHPSDQRPYSPPNSPVSSAPPNGGGAASEPMSAGQEYINTLLNDLNAPRTFRGGADDESQENEIPFFRPGGVTPEEIWDNFSRLLPTWKPLRELGTLRSVPVMGSGDRHAAIMFVGEAPNYYDEKSGEPFQGEAGNKLNGILKAMGLERRHVYLTHLVKFRPSLPRQTTNNRPPNEKEIRFSVPVLEREVGLVQPKVIVALGVVAARGMLNRGDIPLSAYQQRQETFCGIPVVVTHHPSYLLRTCDLRERRRLWEDMLRVMSIAGLPISARQQSYFLK